MSVRLVCPECGSSEFTATLTTRTEYTYNAYEGMQPLEVSEEVTDGGDLGDVDEFICTGCCETFENLDDSCLITFDAYESGLDSLTEFDTFIPAER